MPEIIGWYGACSSRSHMSSVRERDDWRNEKIRAYVTRHALPKATVHEIGQAVRSAVPPAGRPAAVRSQCEQGVLDVFAGYAS
jgi:hypothetical protein